MHTRNVFAALGLGAVVLTGLCPESAQAQRFRRGSGGSPMYYGPSQSYYPGWGGGYSQSYYPGGYGYGGGCCDYAHGHYHPGYGGGYAAAPMYGQQPSYGYAPQMYQPGYAYGGPPVAAYGQQPMPGYGFGQPPQPMPGGSASAYPPPVPMPGALAGGGAVPGQPAATLTVNISDEAFEPKTVTVQPGTLVTWVNRGQHPHTVTFPDVNRDSGDLPPGGVFQAVFPTAGTYNYHCRHHPNMTATVTVGPIAGGTGSTTGGTGTTTGTPIK